LVINNATVTQAVANSINAASPVTINGRRVADSDRRKHHSTPASPSATTGGPALRCLATTGTLTLGANLTAVNDSFSTTPSITGFLDLGAANRTITTSGVSPIDLTISAVIQNGTLTKAGSGALVLNAANTFTGSLNLTQGSVLLANAAGAGAGTINITDGAKLAATTAITVSNTLNVNSQFIVGVSTGNLTLSGTLNFASNTPTITIENAFQGTTAVSTTINTAFGGSNVTGFTKNGIGTLVLAGANAATLNGTVNVNDGVLQVNQMYALGGSLMTAGATINLAGGAYTQNMTAGTIALNPVNVSGNGMINSLVANTGIGAVTLANASVLGVGGQQTNVFGNFTNNGNGTLLLTNNLAVVGSLAGSGSLTKEGVSALYVYSGGTASTALVVDQGLLALVHRRRSHDRDCNGERCRSAASRGDLECGWSHYGQFRQHRVGGLGAGLCRSPSRQYHIQLQRDFWRSAGR
jgi:autotransporter-associated beta strand protein